MALIITHTGTAFDSEQLDFHLMMLACHKESYLKKSQSKKSQNIT